MGSYHDLIKQHKQLTVVYKQLTEREREKYGAEILRKIGEKEKQLKAITTAK
jgi:hypothetical protein